MLHQLSPLLDCCSVLHRQSARHLPESPPRGRVRRRSMQVDPHQFSSQFKANLRLAFHVLGCKHTAEEELMSLAVGGQVSTAHSARPTSAVCAKLFSASFSYNRPQQPASRLPRARAVQRTELVSLRALAPRQDLPVDASFKRSILIAAAIAAECCCRSWCACCRGPVPERRNHGCASRPGAPLSQQGSMGTGYPG